MDKEKVIKILEFYKEIDGEISIYRRILHDYESQYYNTIGAMANDGQQQFRPPAHTTLNCRFRGIL